MEIREFFHLRWKSDRNPKAYKTLKEATTLRIRKLYFYNLLNYEQKIIRSIWYICTRKKNKLQLDLEE